jgi:hypothetical protein
MNTDAFSLQAIPEDPSHGQDLIPAESLLDENSQELHNEYKSILARRPIDKLAQIPNAKVAISITENRITLDLSGEVSGHIKCDRFMNSDIFIVESSCVDKGYGPLLYDIAMETVTKHGCMLVSDRKIVSDDAFKVWKYYYENRPDIRKQELAVGHWHMGPRTEEYFKTMTEDTATWPDKSDPIWSLWHGYQKDPEILHALEDGNLLEVRDVNG